MAKGRKTGGRVKGTKNEATIDREWERELVRRQVLKHRGPLIDAQLRHALGIGHLMLRDVDSGKWQRVESSGSDETDKARIDAAIAMGTACWIYLKDPSVQAFTDLMNRALDKPAEQLKVTNADGGPLEIVIKSKPW